MSIVSAETAAGRVRPTLVLAQVHRDARGQYAAEQRVRHRQRHELGMRRIDHASADAYGGLRRVGAIDDLRDRLADWRREQPQRARAFCPTAQMSTHRALDTCALEFTGDVNARALR